MDRLRAIELFVAIAEEGGLARAGRRLGLSPPAVTRGLAALETRLRVRLLNRTTRGQALTEAGQRFLARARRLLADLQAAEGAVAGETAAPRGHLTVTASVTFGRLAVVPLLCRFQERHPEVTATALLLDRVASLVEEGIDVAVRIAPLADSSLVARRVGAISYDLVASPAYLERHGTPARAADLERHAIIAMTGLMPGRTWRYPGRPGERAVTLTPRLVVTDAAAALEAALAGHGITRSTSYLTAAPLRAGRLVRLLEPQGPVPVALVHPQGRLAEPKIRAFLDFMAPELRRFLADPA